MTDGTRHFDDDAELRVSRRVEADLRELFEPPARVPPQVDRAVLDRAYRHFRQIPAASGRRRFHGGWFWRVAAAAAVIILVFSLDLAKRAERTGERSKLGESVAIDIDQNGRVDILDAFKLARQIESAGPARQEWDVNDDGRVDIGDVDMVAFAAVRLDRGVL